MRLPEIGIRRAEISPRALAERRVPGLSRLPAVIHLHHIHPEPRPGLDLFQQEIHIYARIPRTVAPGVAEKHPVAGRLVFPQAPLVVLHRRDTPGAPSRIGQHCPRITRPGEGDAASGARNPDVPRRFHGTCVWQRGELEENQSPSGQGVLDMKHIAGNLEVVLQRKPFALEDKLVMRVRLIHQLDLGVAQVQRGKHEVFKSLNRLAFRLVAGFRLLKAVGSLVGRIALLLHNRPHFFPRGEIDGHTGRSGKNLEAVGERIGRAFRDEVDHQRFLLHRTEFPNLRCDGERALHHNGVAARMGRGLASGAAQPFGIARLVLERDSGQQPLLDRPFPLDQGVSDHQFIVTPLRITALVFDTFCERRDYGNQNGWEKEERNFHGRQDPA